MTLQEFGSVLAGAMVLAGSITFWTNYVFQSMCEQEDKEKKK